MISIDQIVRPVKPHLVLFEKAYRGQFVDRFIPDTDYFQTDHGKRLRPIIFFLSQGLTGKPNTRSVPLAVLIELLHTASLVHDDVLDGADQRRGKRSYFARKGSRASILAGDYLMAKALSIGVSVPQRDVLRIVAHTVLCMTRGELLQNTLEHSDNTDVKVYYRIIREKTASLFSAACEFAALVQNATALQKSRLKKFGNAFGTGFQIRDDILDFTGNRKRLGKPTGLDIRNGQKTLPVLLALREASKKERDTVLRKIRNLSASNRRWITGFVGERNGVDHTRKEADRWTEHAQSILLRFPPSACRRSLEMLLQYDSERVA